MDTDTRIGEGNGRFPTTRRSALVAVRDGDPAARAVVHEAIVAAYWKPVYKYIRMKWKVSNEDAKDLTQGFFLLALEKESFDGYDAGKGTFRTFLRVCLDGFLSNERKSAMRQKRGGEAVFVALEDFAQDESPDLVFTREWTRSLFELALAGLREHCEQRGKSVQYSLFERYDLTEEDHRTTYAQLAVESGLSTVTITNHLFAMRRDFRRIVLEKLREITVTEQEFRSEACALLGTKV